MESAPQRAADAHAFCHQHQTPAVGTCERCGDFRCEQCLAASRATLATQALCAACASRLPQRIEIPWESSTASIPQRFWQTLKLIAHNPRAFADGFANGPVLPAFTFAAVIQVLYWSALIGGLTVAPSSDSLFTRLSGLVRIEAFEHLFNVIFLVAIYTIVRTVGGRGTWTDTLRVFFYSYAFSAPGIVTEFIEKAGVAHGDTLNTSMMTPLAFIALWFETRALAVRHQLSRRRTTVAVVIALVLVIILYSVSGVPLDGSTG